MIILTVLVCGCSSIAQSQAEDIALQFVKQRVKFFAEEEDIVSDVPKYNIDSLDSYKEGSSWVVLIHVSSTIDNITKKNDLVVRINNGGKVTEFNGQKIK